MAEDQDQVPGSHRGAVGVCVPPSFSSGISELLSLWLRKGEELSGPASVGQVREADITPGHLVLGSDFPWDKLVASVSSSFSSLFCGGISVSLTSAAYVNPEFCSQPSFDFACSHRMISILGKQNKRVIESLSPTGTIPRVQALKRQPLEDGTSPFLSSGSSSFPG